GDAKPCATDPLVGMREAARHEPEDEERREDANRLHPNRGDGLLPPLREARQSAQNPSFGVSSFGGSSFGGSSGSNAEETPRGPRGEIGFGRLPKQLSVMGALFVS